MLPFVTLFGKSIPVYGLTGLLGFLLGLGWVLIRAPGLGLKRDDGVYIYVFSAIGGLLGAKLLYILTVLPELLSLLRSGARLSELWGYVAGGLVFYGAVLGGLPAAYFSARAYKVSLADYLPLLVLTLALIGFAGRIGCFCAGCCYGVESSSTLAVVYPEASLSAPSGVPLFPVQLFESAAQLALFLLLAWFTLKPARARYAAELYLLCYAPLRFALEFFRGDTARGAIGALSTSQWLSIAAFSLASLCLFIRKRRKMPD